MGALACVHAARLSTAGQERWKGSEYQPAGGSIVATGTVTPVRKGLAHSLRPRDYSVLPAARWAKRLRRGLCRLGLGVHVRTAELTRRVLPILTRSKLATVNSRYTDDRLIRDCRRLRNRQCEDTFVGRAAAGPLRSQSLGAYCAQRKRGGTHDQAMRAKLRHRYTTGMWL